MNQTRSTFKALFENDLRLLRCDACISCDANIKHPLLPWLLGQKFTETPERLVFVGKPHRGAPGTLLASGILDATEEVEGEESLWNSSWAYWSYTRAIAERLYGKNAFDSIALTNLIKCTSTHGADATTWAMAQNCLMNLGVVWREFTEIEPRTAVFYTYGLYRELLEPVPIAAPGTLRNITAPEYAVPCGAKNLGWWERVCRTSWGDELRILVVGHPERKNKADYVRRLVQWIRPSLGSDV